jgi:hypothetical protein
MIPLSDRLPGRASEPSRTRVDGDGGYGTFLGWSLGPLGFSWRCEFIGRGARSVDARGAHTMGRRDQGVGRATTRCGRLVARFCLSFGLRLRVSKIGTSAFVLSNFENISLVKIWNRKTAENRNWHCGILLIGYFQKMHKSDTKCKQNIKQLV